MALANLDYDNHPLFNPLQLYLETRTFQQVRDTVQRWIWVGSTGGLITGTARVGKSTAFKKLATQLVTRGGIAIPTCYMFVRRRDQHTVASIFRRMCLSVGLRATQRDIADDMSERMVHYLSDRAAEANCSQAVLIVDEMQRLSLEQLEACTELYDALTDLGILLTVIFVGNDPGCWNLVRRIQEPENQHIRSRFFSQGCTYPGLTSESEVKYCLSQYDTLRYPTDGPSYSGYFLEKAVADGWRFASLSTDLWRVFRTYQKDYQIESWGMKYFTVTVNLLLTDFLPRYGVDAVDDEMLHVCIRNSDLIPSLTVPAHESV